MFVQGCWLVLPWGLHAAHCTKPPKSPKCTVSVRLSTPLSTLPHPITGEGSPECPDAGHHKVSLHPEATRVFLAGG